MILWIVFELLWNFTAYFLEFENYNVFFDLWIVACCFFLVNVYMIYKCIKFKRITITKEIEDEPEEEETKEEDVNEIDSVYMSDGDDNN